MINFKDIETEDGICETNLSEINDTDLAKLPKGVTLHLMDNYFPDCYITRKGKELNIQIEEHIYTKYWFHKYHASVFAEAMLKAIKRLTAEGVPFSDSTLDDEDEVHLFVRWTLTEPVTISSKELENNVNLAYETVYARANLMLDNSDSVLILGKDTGAGLVLLKKIQTHLDNLGFYTYIIKEQPEKIGESVIQKVLRYGLSSRFVIIENTEPTGHLYEFPHVAKLAELVCIVLQKEGKGATWMFEDLYHRLKSIKKFEYENVDLETQIDKGIKWANNYLKNFGEYQLKKLPWLRKI